MDWKNKIVGHAEVPPDQLLAHPENWFINLKSIFLFVVISCLLGFRVLSKAIAQGLLNASDCCNRLFRDITEGYSFCE